jgi:hypothetical protein
VVDASVAIGASEAAHIGELDECPVAMVERAGPWVRRAIAAYQALKRLGIQPQDLTDRAIAALLVVDSEADRLSSAEARRASAMKG